MAPDAPLTVAKTERPYTMLNERGGYACPHCGKAFADRAVRITGDSIAPGGKAGKRRSPSPC